MLTCRYCGTKNPAGSTYCNHCGGAFNGPAARSHAPGASSSASSAAPQPAPQPAPSSVRAASATATPPGKPHNATGSLPPQTLLHNRYLVLKTIGQGGMAAVYRGLDTKTRRDVAIKEMSQESLAPDEQKEALESFESEAAMLQRLQHPNLPRVWDRFSDGSRHYLVMDFVDGETLEQRQQAAGGKPLPEGEVMEWARQLCSVLSYLHNLRPPIIFRDLKPANVMLTRSGQIKLIDFGIARVFHPGSTRDTQVLGTPGFAPPEQYGKSQTDARADVYALGVTLYQLLTGYDPGTTPFTLPPANSRNPRIAPHIQATIERATKLDRDTRYPTVAAFEKDLLHPDGFVFRGGQRARTVPELVALCRALPVEAQEYLYNRRFEAWLNSIGQPETARLAAKIASAGGNPAAGLTAFMTQATRPQGQPRVTQQPRPQQQVPQWPRQPVGARPQPPQQAGSWGTLAGPGAAQAGRIATRLAGQVASKMGSATARRLMAHAAAAAASIVGTQILVEVRPHVANFGALMAGQPAQMAVTVAGQNGLPVSGRVEALANWLRVDRTTFVGPLTSIQLSVDTSRMSPGLHQTNLRITSGSQQVYVPVSVDVLSTRTLPNRPAAGPKPAPKRARARRSWFGFHLSERARAGLSLGLSATLAGAGAVGLALAEQAHAALLPGWMSALAPVFAAGVLGAALGGAIGRFEPKVPARLFTALLLAALGVGVALLLVSLGSAQANSPLSSLSANALQGLREALAYIGAVLGAALGATQRISAGVLKGLAFLARNSGPIFAVGFVTLGGVLGWMLLRNLPGLAPCGTIVGLVVATAIVVRMARVRPRSTLPHP